MSDQAFSSSDYLYSLLSKAPYWRWSQQGMNPLSAADESKPYDWVLVSDELSLQHLTALWQSLFGNNMSMDFAPTRWGQQGGIRLLVSEEAAATIKDKLHSDPGFGFDSAILSPQRPLLDSPGLLVMDMDSTVIQIECIDELAKLAGVGDKVSEITEQAMQGKLDFAQSLQARLACLAGANEAILAQVLATLPIMPGLSELVSALQAKGWRIAIASGGFDYFAKQLQQQFKLDAVKANKLAISEGKLIGSVDGKIVDAQGKADALRQWQAQWQIASSQTLAMGDGANDLPMMQTAALGVAYHAKPIVQQQADAGIRFGGLDTLLHYLA